MTEPARTRRSVVLTETVDGLTPVLMIFSIFLTLRGHNAPGGGFAGGLVMGLAVVLRYLAAGPRGVRTLRVDPIVLIGVGLLFATSVGLASLIADGSFLASTIWQFDAPVLGKIKIVSSSLFDIGVHILVVGAAMAVLVALAEADDEMGRRS